MNPRRLHKITGLILLLPFISWSLTAVFFLVRPRYEQAYEVLSVRQYPLQEQPAFVVEPDWQELRYFQTTLGQHLLVKKEDTWHHLDAKTLKPFPAPNEAQLTLLLKDAFLRNPARYGEITAIEGKQISTSTGVDITMNWDNLSFSQQGRDTRWINQIYSIHYLEWTGVRWLDKVLGLSGLALLLYMTYSGGKLALGRPTLRSRPGV